MRIITSLFRFPYFPARGGIHVFLAAVVAAGLLMNCQKDRYLVLKLANGRTRVVNIDKTSKKIVLNGANIKSLSGLEQYRDLETLNLSYNQLTAVPSMAGLKKLKHLHLNGNKIKKIAGLNGLGNLMELNLSNNSKISKIEGLEGLKKLKLVGLLGIRISWAEREKARENYPHIKFQFTNFPAKEN